MPGMPAMLLKCGSGLARDGLHGAAFTQLIRVIVDEHREQARSHKGRHRLHEQQCPARPVIYSRASNAAAYFTTPTGSSPVKDRAWKYSGGTSGNTRPGWALNPKRP